MSPLFRFPDATKRSAAVNTWLHLQPGEPGKIARHWFGVIRACGEDVREILHDGHPTACVGDAAFASIDTFQAHVNVGFFFGAEIADPKRLLEGSGKRMRHVKVRPGVAFDAAALTSLIRASYADMKRRVETTADGCR
ncbi:MAG TPA: DUF1801 domain-containing protein [Lacunisphaera sp.]|jgi:hypothetical protein|nr:DUF1801 domain-containing protein [Lacunisphaera sp.]